MSHTERHLEFREGKTKVEEDGEKKKGSRIEMVVGHALIRTAHL